MRVSQNPLPYTCPTKGESCSWQALSFEPPCPERRYDAPSYANFTGDCSGRFPVLSSIVDVLSVPAGLAPGEYTLGFRYDSEVTAQVWSACADISIVAPDDALA